LIFVLKINISVEKKTTSATHIVHHNAGEVWINCK
jgi:hypothetical protein